MSLKYVGIRDVLQQITGDLNVLYPRLNLYNKIIRSYVLYLVSGVQPAMTIRLEQYPIN